MSAWYSEMCYRMLIKWIKISKSLFWKNWSSSRSCPFSRKFVKSGSCPFHIPPFLFMLGPSFYRCDCPVNMANMADLFYLRYLTSDDLLFTRICSCGGIAAHPDLERFPSGILPVGRIHLANVSLAFLGIRTHCSSIPVYPAFLCT